MPIISRVEARTPRGRLIHTAIILALTVGGLTMVYPFAIMVSGSLRSPMDQADLSLVPAYLVDKNVLYQKFLEYKYNESAAALSTTHMNMIYSFDRVHPPTQIDQQWVTALERYLTDDQTPFFWKRLGGIQSRGHVPANLWRIRQQLQSQYNNDLVAFSQSTGIHTPSWLAIVVTPPRWADQRFDFDQNALWQAYLDTAASAPAAELSPTPVTGHFLATMVYPVFGKQNPSAFAAAINRELASYEAFRLPSTAPTHGEKTLRALWIEYVRKEINPAFITMKVPDQARYHAFIRKLYQGDIAQLNREWKSTFASFAELPLPQGHTWLQGAERQAHRQFVDTLPADEIKLVGPEYDWPHWLLEQGLIRNVEDAPPLAQVVMNMEYQHVLEHPASLRWQFATASYRTVWDELLLEGRALANTFVYCVLSVLLALLVNPLAAYGLSRFKLRGTYKILLVLMATVAFPPMVTLIPQFIMLRQAGLMNTMVALVLPMIANGYLIFLLKGFFDSLPEELFEAGRIDGASELRLFFQFAMAMSKPILAVLALNTFTAAYAAFLYPLLVAPDPDMWLISVWLYQFQLRASSAAVYASVIIASIPTLLIFMFVQRTIMRGIVVPTEK